MSITLSALAVLQGFVYSTSSEELVPDMPCTGESVVALGRALYLTLSARGETGAVRHAAIGHMLQPGRRGHDR